MINIILSNQFYKQSSNFRKKNEFNIPISVHVMAWNEVTVKLQCESHVVFSVGRWTLLLLTVVLSVRLSVTFVVHA